MENDLIVTEMREFLRESREHTQRVEQLCKRIIEALEQLVAERAASS
jgi:hypothetical protein